MVIALDACVSAHARNKKRNVCISFLTLHICEQVLFVYVFTIIPPRLTDQRNFISLLIVTQELEQTMLLFLSTACCVMPHGLHTADRR